MGEFRDYRLVIPSAILVITFLSILIPADYKQILSFINDNELDSISELFGLLIGLIAGGYVGGFLCGNITSNLAPQLGIFVNNERIKQLESSFIARKLDKLLETFGDKPEPFWQNIMAECDTRMHAHAPKEFIDYCTRRLNAVYTSLNSIVAILLAILLAFALNDVRLFIISIGYCKLTIICSAIILIIISLWIHAEKADNEHWRACSKFIYWDLITNPPTEKLGE